MCREWAQIMNTFMLTEYWPPTEEAYPAEHDAEQPAEQQVALQPQQAVAEQQPQVYDNDEQSDNNRGILTRLQETQWSAAQRTVQRIHRNLGHPTNLELAKLLKSKNASPSIVAAAQQHHCQLCDAHRPPPQVAKSTLRTGGSFNSRVQADTVWIHLPRIHNGHKPQAVPVLSMIDATTKFMSARVIDSEQSDDFIRGLERGWIRHFGPPTLLQVDDHRGWSSDTTRTWTSDLGIQLEISPGQAHTRLSVLERRHQVLRRGIELFTAAQQERPDFDPRMSTRERITQALCYVIPQINNTTNVQGFSPTQWAMGMQPRIPGVLMDHDLTTAQLTPSEAMEQKLHLQKQAAISVIEADNDARLRRALLRQHQAVQYTYSTGQLVYYWRDAPGGAGPKIRWKGPATVVMTEPGRTGPSTNTYWITHGSTLLRVSGEHLRPDLNHQSDTDPLQRARQALDNIRGRSTTLYTDLIKSNKRKRTEIVTDDEEEMPEAPDTEATAPDPQPAQQDYWDIEEDGITWHRIHVSPRQALYTPNNDDTAPWQNFQDIRRTVIMRPHQPARNRTVFQDDWTLPNATRSMPFQWTGSTTFVLRTDRHSGSSSSPPNVPTTTPTPMDEDGDGHAPGDEPQTDTTAAHEQSRQGAPPGAPTVDLNITEITEQDSTGEPEPPPSTHGAPTPHATTASVHYDGGQIPEHQQQLYAPPAPTESFHDQRTRFDRQETLSLQPTASGQDRYGPQARGHNTTRGPTPYAKPAPPDPDMALTLSTYDTDLNRVDDSTLPPGWKLENGFLTLDVCKDEWTIQNNKLIRRHYIPRNQLFDPADETAGCPLPLHYISKDRHTTGSANLNKYDRWKKKGNITTEHAWTGQTSFKIMPAYRLLAHEAFYNVSHGHQTYVEPTTEQAHTAEETGPPGHSMPGIKARKDQLNERRMTLADRLAFMEAKKKELESFFQNDVWEMVKDNGTVPSDRILKAHFILKWTKWPNGEPRAKARLITQGFKDRS